LNSLERDILHIETYDEHLSSFIAIMDQPLLKPLATTATAYVKDASLAWIFGIIAGSYYVISIILARNRGFKAPMVGFYSVFEPAFFARHRFFRHGAEVINEGYTQVRRILQVSDLVKSYS
jgi:hypothetical protein